jgi:hypothetical protein
MESLMFLPQKIANVNMSLQEVPDIKLGRWMIKVKVKTR